MTTLETAGPRALSTWRQEARGVLVGYQHEADSATTPSHGTSLWGIVPSGDTLMDLLERVRSHHRGWDSAAGVEVLALVRSRVRRAETQWIHTAGDLGEASVSEVWEELDRWVRSGADTDPGPILTAQARKKTAAHAAAAQTGMGSSRTKGLVALAKERAIMLTELSAADQLCERDLTPTEHLGCPLWMQTVTLMLTKAGWNWPILPDDALIAAVEQAVYGHRRARSSLVRHGTGLPAGVWSALELLVDGSAPSCRIQTAWVPPIQTFAIAGVDAVSSCREVRRLVAAAVAGAPSRTGKDWRKPVVGSVSSSTDQGVAS
ncbi:hypothetical protein EH165_02400 [Nakamurella antarctica]|uniref:Uncharacterized protein n=1 Tax=Nakamurella antarctica TaxID=1902245 RepID=A0A3G8ZSZ3_9ACTN|nr:hypothetical protein [Nakamurella antarctica]AZI57176.1 hypothetical protein EH165_02400 [Nakamurella antarctica]